MKTYAGEQATMIASGLDLAANQYKRLSLDPQLPPRLQETFREYARDLEVIAYDVRDAQIVRFED